MRWHIMLALTAGLGLPPLSVLHAEDETDSKASENKSTKAEVPYRLTGTNHLMVRAKINGKGPFNLIVDTGAPAVFITKKVAKKAKTDIDEKDWAKFDSFELEGGLKIDKVRARVEDLVQIEGMNSMGLAGAELHGVIGYQLLSRFRIEYDLTNDKLVFEPLKYTPPELLPLGKKGADDIQSMGPMVKMMAALLGLKPNFDVVPRGFTGIEFADKDGKVTITRVLADSPAAKAGLKVGDIVTSVKTVSVDSEKDLTRALEKAGIGTKWRFYITRDGKEQEIVVVLGKGL